MLKLIHQIVEGQEVNCKEEEIRLKHHTREQGPQIGHLVLLTNHRLWLKGKGVEHVRELSHQRHHDDRVVNHLGQVCRKDTPLLVSESDLLRLRLG